MNKNKIRLFVVLFVILLISLSILGACSFGREESPPPESGTAYILSQNEEETGQITNETEQNNSSDPIAFDITSLPEYDGEPYVYVNHNIPFFTDDEYANYTGESYSDLDSLGRCGICMARITPESMPAEERGMIGDIKPTGWDTVKYEGIDGNYLYNRCHLIGWQLTGQNSNPCNLITGTRYMNVSGMEPFETRVANYVRNTKRPVLYRVTPVFEGSNLLASGVLIEASSIEDDKISFCVYCFNVQPGVTIDYTDGSSIGPAYTGQSETETKESDSSTSETKDNVIDENVTFVGNSNSFKFHLPSCQSIEDMAEHNKVYFYGTREEVIQEGYEPCKRCNP